MASAWLRRISRDAARHHGRPALHRPVDEAGYRGPLLKPTPSLYGGLSVFDPCKVAEFASPRPGPITAGGGAPENTLAPLLCRRSVHARIDPGSWEPSPLFHWLQEPRARGGGAAGRRTLEHLLQPHSVGYLPWVPATDQDSRADQTHREGPWCARLAHWARVVAGRARAARWLGLRATKPPRRTRRSQMMMLLSVKASGGQFEDGYSHDSNQRDRQHPIRRAVPPALASPQSTAPGRRQVPSNAPLIAHLSGLEDIAQGGYVSVCPRLSGLPAWAMC